MSKVDAQRAMREAKFAALEAQAKAQSQGKGQGSTPARVAPSQGRRAESAAPTDDKALVKPAKTSAKRASKRAAEPTAEPIAEAAGEVVAEELCGHRSIGNKRCQRPSGHPEANHRYK